MSELMAQVREDLITARKARDKARLALLSMTLSELKNAVIDGGEELDDTRALAVITSAVKRRREAASQAEELGRDEHAATERAEAEMLSVCLPPQLSEEEVRAKVRAAIAGGADQMGAVMGLVMPELKGRFDGKEAGRIVREELAG
jgi:uncharacterized protein YqeY